MSVNSALTATAPVRQQLPVPQFFSFNQRMPLPGGPTSASGPTRKRSDLGLLSWCLQVGPDEVRSSHFGEKLEALRSAQGGWLSPPVGSVSGSRKPGSALERHTLQVTWSKEAPETSCSRGGPSGCCPVPVSL